MLEIQCMAMMKHMSTRKILNYVSMQHNHVPLQFICGHAGYLMDYIVTCDLFCSMSTCMLTFLRYGKKLVVRF